MSPDIPRDVILPVDVIDVVLDPAPHPYEIGNEAAIQRSWVEEKAAKPALFDGTVVLLATLRYRDGRIEGRCHAVRYATFLHWRGTRAGTAQHAFAHAMLVSSDNALIAVRMAGHTVNAGKVYFAAGSFEPEDFPSGRVDADLNMRREVLEETGLDLATASADDRYHALSTSRGTVIVRRYFFRETADELVRRIEAFVAKEVEPEISGPVVILGPDEEHAGLMPHMKALAAWHFGSG